MRLKFYSIRLISLYQKYISPHIRPSCVFYPSCSEYAKSAIEKYGFVRGVKLSVSRILRCHPWQKRHFDPLP